MSELILLRPEPELGATYQPGIVDPVWPAEPPDGIPDARAYVDRYAGQLERQRHLHIITADVDCRSRAELADVLVRLNAFARHQMAKRPPPADIRPFDQPVTSRRVTVTIGFGATLFTTRHGDDRFELAPLRPTGLKIMPRIDGDDPSFLPEDAAADLVILVASDDYYVNEYIFGRLYYGGVHPEIRVRGLERGYARPDSREPSGFEDGLTNPRGGRPDSPMHEAVFVQARDGEPSWCVGGTYLAYRKIRRRLVSFFRLSDRAREAVFGVDAAGARLPWPSADAHAQKMNPKRSGHRDLLGLDDDARRFLRRPYFFDDGLDVHREEFRGVHHLSFARDLVTHYEWPVLMWQTNPDFPTKGAGLDRLYADGGAANVGGGYYFVPARAESLPLGQALVGDAPGGAV